MIFTSKIIQIFAIWIASVAVFFGMAVWLFGTMFNDTADAQWQRSLNSAVLWTFAIFIAIIVVSICSHFFNWSDSIKTSVAIFLLITAIGDLFIGPSPFIAMYFKSKQAINIIISDEIKKNTVLVQAYIKNNKVLDQEEVKQYFNKRQTSSQKEVDEIDKAYILGWQQLLDAKLINPNMTISTVFYIDKKEIDGVEPLLSWVISKRADFAKALLEHGANPNATDDIEKNTALIELSKQRLISIGSLPKEDYFTKFDLLVSFGADINYKNKKSATALDYANQNHDYLTEQIKNGISVYDQKDLEIVDELIGKIKSAISNAGK